MPSTTRSPQSRPHGAPAYYLARPASVWITVLHRQPPAALQQPTVHTANFQYAN
jgi:hypothetical protein